VDPYGNAYPAGLSVEVGAITGIVITGSTFEGTDFVIDSAGEFFYSGTPAAGNLVESVASAAGVDSFGNNYIGGHATYAAFAASLAAGFMAFYTGSLAAGWAFQSQIETDSSGDLIMETAGGTLILSAAGGVAISGSLTVGGSPDTGSSGLPNGTISGSSGQINTGGGTAHTHSGGSYAVTNGVHAHTL
jgi:hypothetical protein